VTAEVLSACTEGGLILRSNRDTTPGDNNVLVLAPPLSITDEDLGFIVETLKGSFEQL